MTSNELQMLWGKVYVQAGTEGLASYHFSRLENYISYSNAPSSWKDDAGNKFPLKKAFEQIKVDPVKRIFEAVVFWTPSVNGGDVEWRYRMKFSADFLEIVDGTCSMVDAHGTITEITFGVELRYRLLNKLTFC